MTGEARPLRILLVDDHDQTLSILAKLLRMSGYQVHTASTARQAVEAAAMHPCDLLISDLGLPDRTGLELMRELKPLYRMKGIALTGYTADRDVRDAQEAGFDRHVKKPVSFDDLLKTIRGLDG